MREPAGTRPRSSGRSKAGLLPLQALFVAVVGIMLLVSVGAIHMFSVGGAMQEAVVRWGRTHSEMRLRLRRYLISSDPADIRVFEEHLRTARAYSRLRVLLETPDYDLEAMRAAALAAGIRDADAGRLLALAWVARWLAARESLEPWRRADECTEDLERLASSAVGSGSLERADRVRLLDAVDRLHERALDVQERLLLAEQSWSDEVLRLLLSGIVLGAALLTAIGLAILRRVLGRLAESDRRFRQMVEAAEDGVWVCDAAGVTTYLNRRMADILGRAPEELAGQLCLPFVGRETSEQAKAFFPSADAVLSGQYEVSLRRADGSEVPVIASVTPFAASPGSADGILAVVTDITARRRNEEALREANERLRGLMEASPLAIVALDTRKRVTMWNPAAERVFGWAAQEVVGREISYVPEGELASSDSLFARASKGETLFEVEVRRRRKDGKPIELSLSTAPLRDRNGAVVGTVAIYLDVSERNEVQRALRRSEERFRALFDRNQAGVSLTTLDGRFVQVNAAFAEMLGYSSPAELMGQPVAAVYAGGEEARSAVIAPILEEGRRAHFEVRFRHRNGRTVPVASAAATITQDGEERLIIANVIDISERKALEEQLRQSQRVEVVGQLAGGVAHDFNNKLMVILGHLEAVLAEGVLREDVRRQLEAARSAARRAADLTRQLLAFTRRQVLSPRVIGLGRMVADSESLLRRVVGESIRLECRQHGEPWQVKVDPGQFEQVLMNLVVNARDAMPDGGAITIETSNVVLDDGFAERSPGASPGEHVLVRVSDAGCGMDEKTLERIFEPFFTTKGAGRHTGLGLCTTYGIVKQSGGYIQVQSRPGAGTRADVYLPRVPEAGRQPEAAGGEHRSRARTAAGEGGAVLLVEDEEGVRDLLTHALQRRGYRVLAAASGEEALRVCGRPDDRIDLILTDLVMPGMSGLEMFERAREVRPNVKAIFMSGYSDEATPGLCGTYPFLGKPFSTSTLVERVREVLQG